MPRREAATKFYDTKMCEGQKKIARAQCLSTGFAPRAPIKSPMQSGLTRDMLEPTRFALVQR